MDSRSTPHVSGGSAVGAGPLSGVTQPVPGHGGNEADSVMSSQVHEAVHVGPARADRHRDERRHGRGEALVVDEEADRALRRRRREDAEHVQLGHLGDRELSGIPPCSTWRIAWPASGSVVGLDRDRLGRGEEPRARSPATTA